MQIFEISDSIKFDNFILSQGASGLQSWAWGELNKRLGRKVWRLMVTSDVGKPRMAATLIKLPLPFVIKRGNFNDKDMNGVGVVAVLCFVGPQPIAIVRASYGNAKLFFELSSQTHHRRFPAF